MKTLELETDAMARLAASDCSACCFTCKHWIGKRRKQTTYCMRLNLSGKDAPSGDSMCVLWEKRPNARITPNAEIRHGGPETHD